MKQSSADHEGTLHGRALAVLGMLVFCIPLVGYGLRDARFDGQPAAVTTARSAFASEFALTNYDLLVSWQGSTADDPRIQRLVDHLLGTPGPDGVLRGGSQLIASVMTPAQVLSTMTADEIQTDEAVRKVAGLWLGRGGFKLQLTDSGLRDPNWTMERIREAVAAGDPRLASVMVIRMKSQTTPTGSATPLVPVPHYDLEVVTTSNRDIPVSKSAMRERILQTRGYATADQPEGQRLVADVFESIGSPIALRVSLSSAGRSSLLAAAGAIGDAAAQAGIRSQDLQISGRALEAAQRADVLRRLAWSPSDRHLPLLTSPMQVGIAGAFFVWLVLNGFALRSVMAAAAAVFAAASFAAVFNIAGLSWSDSLLGVPPLVFLLVLAFSVLDRAGLENHFARPLSLHTVLAAMVILGMLCVGELSQPQGRLFVIAGSLGVCLSWLMATAVLPLLNSLIPSPAASCPRSIWEFSNWATSHTRAAGMIAALVVGVTSAVLLQPGTRLWLSCSEVPADVPADALEIERTLSGTGHLTVAIRFADEARQRMRFAQRVEIVREATEGVRRCTAVTGAFSIADTAPAIEPLPANARPRDRANYVRKSNAIEEKIRTADLQLGTSWISPPLAARDADSNDEIQNGPETWRVDAAILRNGFDDPQQVLQEVDAALQQVFRFHAGVSHSLTTDLAQNSTLANRQPRVAASLFAVAVIAAAMAASSLAAGLILAVICIVPMLAIVFLPGYGFESLGASEWLAMLVPGSFGLMASIELTVRYRTAVAAGTDRCEALSLSLAAGAAVRGSLLMALIAGSAALAFTAPGFVQPAVRLAVVCGIWSLALTVVVTPLLLAGGLGNKLAKAPAILDQSTGERTVEISLPVRLDPAAPEPTPHIEISKARRRTRRAS